MLGFQAKAGSPCQNGLGLRVGKQDSTGSYVYTCDGTSPGSPVLSDIYNIYTPGQSEHRGSTSYFYANDRLGNLWTLDAAGASQSYYQDTSGFGGLTAWGGGTSSQFKFGGGSGCQTDADTGLVLMGHRYMDTRIGRFLTQDHARAGSNWYAYCGNDPVNKTDPSGNVGQTVNGGSASIGGPDYLDALNSAFFTVSDSLDTNLSAMTDSNDGNVLAAANQAMSIFLPFEGQGQIEAGVFGDGISVLSSVFNSNPWLAAASTLSSTYGLGQSAISLYAAGTATFNGGFGAFLSFRMGGALVPLGAGVMGEGAGMLAVSFAAASLGVVGAAYGGYTLGTAISNIKVDKQGTTVSGAIANFLYPPSSGMLILQPQLCHMKRW